MSNLSFDFDSPGDAAVCMPRELILASAGSGKTFRIASRIIGLLAHGERADSIFASTFTRKAAGEILERVLIRLARAAMSDEDAAALAAEAALRNGSPPPATRTDWQVVLERVVADLHRMNVSTLDAFFIRTAGSFAYEIGLPPSWRIIDEPAADALRADALGDVLRETDASALIALVRAQARDAVSRSVHGSLLRDAQKLVDIHHALREPDGDAWDTFAAFRGRAVPLEALRSRREALAATLLAAEVPANRDGSPSVSWQGAIAAAATQIRDGAWDELLKSTLCRAAHAAAGGSYQSKPVPAEIRAIFEQVRTLVRDTLGPRYAEQIAAQGRIAALLSDTLERRRRATGGHRFDDVTRLLGGPAALGRCDLHYRLDMRTRHVLLDEFQDTSLPQWEALEPLVSELLSGHAAERAAVIVADPKQSIYGWRGASPLLVQQIRRRYALDADVLAKSWRSSRVVLDVVNRIFENVATLPVWNGDDRAADTAAAWRASFETHEAAKDLPGYVELRAGPADESREHARPGLCREAARIAAGLHAEAPHRSIGILTRTNKAVARIMYELGQLHVPASEEGGVPLLDAAPVAALLALLKLADHPGDTLARYHVARTPLGAIAGLADSRDEIAACRLAHGMRRRLVEDGYGNTLAELAHRLGSSCSARERRRVGQLVELAFRYDAGATLRPGDFIDIVATERVEDVTAAQVRVMTVHQAKGLEFDIVILPQLDQPLKSSEPGPVPLRADGGAGRVEAVFPFVRAALLPIFADVVPGLADAVRQRDAVALRDSLSGLYVAVTRARHALYMIVAPDGASTGRGCTAARLVRNALHGDERVEPGELLYVHGSADWSGELDVRVADEPSRAAPTAPPAAPDARPDPLLRSAKRRARNLPRRSPSELEGGERIEVRNLLRIDAAGSAQRGTVAHAWFEALSWIEDGAPRDDELRRIARRAAPYIGAAAVDALLPAFRAWLISPAIREALSRARAGSDVVLERELPFLRRDGDTVMEGIIDRLVIRRERGTVTSAEIVDFKTDAVSPGDTATLEQRTAFYRPQMDAYRRAVAGLYGIDSSSVRARLVFVEAGVVRDVHDNAAEEGPA